MICGRCGASGADGAKFCPQCGAAFPADTAWGGNRQFALSVVYPEVNDFDDYKAWGASTVKITVDGGRPYRLKYGEAVSIPVTAGVHSVRFSYVGLGSFCKKDVQLHVAGDRTLVLKAKFFRPDLAFEDAE